MKRFLAIALAAALSLSTAQIPALQVYAEETAPAEETAIQETASQEAEADVTAGASAQDVSSHASRVYRAILADENGRTTGYLELRAPEADLNRLLKDTRIDEIIGDMHMLDTLHVVVVDSADKKTIRAST